MAKDGKKLSLRLIVKLPLSSLRLEKIIIEDCRMLEKEMEAGIVHSLWEENRCADMLSKIGSNQGEQDMVVNVPPDEVVELFKQDMMRIAFLRGF